MLKQIVMVVFLFFLISFNASAETIYFKDGKTVKGNIVEQTHYSVTVQGTGNIPSKYYLNEIDRIEKDVEVQTTLNIDPTQFPGIEQGKIKAIAHLLEVNGTVANVQKNIDEITKKYPAEKTEEIKALLEINGIISTLIPIYNRYLSDSEIKNITAFYESPTGKKLLEVTPALMQEVMQTSIKYFQDKGQAFNSK
jgi:uncharacterized protein